MDKLKELRSIQDVVLAILKQSEKARNSDNELYVEVVKKMNPVALQMPFCMVMTSLSDFALPNFETVRRTRQKIQANNPNLRSERNVESVKKEYLDDFKEYAVEG